ncbi:hypothetical protein MYA_4897 [Burkholderia sp. KJ006]|nr:hypothetical protein MYA_4897 [Burkholderia sp. KJ006]
MFGRKNRSTTSIAVDRIIYRKKTICTMALARVGLIDCRHSKRTALLGYPSNEGRLDAQSLMR